MSIEVEFRGEEAQRFYSLTGAPNVEGVGAMQLTIAPAGLTIHISDGWIRMAVVDGFVVRRDGKDGAFKQQAWTRHEWDRMPAWLAEVVADTGIPLHGRAS